MQTPGTGHSTQANIAAYLKSAYALDRPAAAVVSGVYLDGAEIDRVDPHVALSALLALPAIATMASGHTVTTRVQVQHRALSTDSWEDYRGPQDATFTALDSGAAQGLDLGHGIAIDLAGAKAKIRVRVRPTLSASGVDSLVMGGGVLVLGGFDTNPPSGA